MRWSRGKSKHVQLAAPAERFNRYQAETDADTAAERLSALGWSNFGEYQFQFLIIFLTKSSALLLLSDAEAELPISHHKGLSRAGTIHIFDTDSGKFS